MRIKVGGIYDLKVMVVQKARKQRSVIVRENVIVLYLAHEHSICYKRAAKYRTMTLSLTITDLCFLAFCTTIAFKSYITPTFSSRRFFIYLYKIALALFFGEQTISQCRPKDSGNGRQYASLFRIILAANRCWRQQR